MEIPFSTMHVFSIGYCQLITPDLNKSVPSEDLINLPPFVSYIQSLCPSELGISPYGAINTFYENSVRYLGEENENQVPFNYSIKWEDLDLEIVYALTNEIFEYIPPSPPTIFIVQ